ncbi:MAG: PilX N-terminal domain-containing pilus assembly protein [Pseudomonadota bacterium]
MSMKMPPTHNRKSTRGIALAAVVLLLLVMTLIGTLGLRMAGQQETMVSNLKQMTRAQFAAEQAVRQAIDSQLYLLDDGTDAWTTTGQGSGTDYTYTYIVSKKSAYGTVATTDDGFPYYVVNAEGQSEDARRQIEVAVVSLYNSVTAFDSAFIGCNNVYLNSSIDFDSYNSETGARRTGGADVKSLVTDGLDGSGDIEFNSSEEISGNVWAAGSITGSGSTVIEGNGYANGDINVRGSMELRGDANAVGSVGRSGNIDGNEDADWTGWEPQDCDPLDVENLIVTNGEPIKNNNDNDEHSSIQDNTMTSSGTFGTTGQARSFYLTRINLDSDTINIRGDVTIYIEGNIDMDSDTRFDVPNGSTLTIYTRDKIDITGNTNWGTNREDDYDEDNPDFSLNPANLRIFSGRVSTSFNQNSPEDHSGTGFFLGSSASFAGIVYAPKTGVAIESSSALYGSVRGRWAYANSSADYWYDDKLKDESEFSQPVDLGYKIVYWTESTYGTYSPLGVSTTSTTTTTTAPTTTTSPPTTSGDQDSGNGSGSDNDEGDGQGSTDTIPPNEKLAGERCRYQNAQLQIRIENNSSESCTINSIEVSWPEDDWGKLERIRAGNPDMWREDGVSSPAVFSDLDNNTIGSGDRVNYRLYFENDPSGSTDLYNVIFRTNCGDIDFPAQCP